MSMQSIESTDAISLLQPWSEDFDLIRGFFDEEVHESIIRLCSDGSFVDMLTEFFTITESSDSQGTLNQTVKSTLGSLQSVNTIDALQQLVNEIASPIIEMSVSNLSVSGLDQLSPDRHYLFISNHRDILMDPLLLNMLLYRNQQTTAHCAIGDNLLKNHIALEFAQLNKCFRVLRALKSPKAILKAMKLQSAYIRHLSFNRAENIWIAQKEGRSKDNLDKTNPALIKMLGLARPKEVPFGEYISKLNIVPVSFSYEWDPCDIDKATELLITEQQGHYQKEAIEDLTAVKKGLLQPKGEVHVHFDSELLDGKIDQMNHAEIAQCIDYSIALNSKVFPVNLAATSAISPELLTSSELNLFTPKQINLAAEKLERRLDHCSTAVRTRVLQNYAVSVKR